MPCLHANGLVLCVSSPRELRRIYLRCKTCQQRRLSLVRMYDWYDPSAVCLTCGEDPRDRKRYLKTTQRQVRMRLEALNAKRAWENDKARRALGL